MMVRIRCDCVDGKRWESGWQYDCRECENGWKSGPEQFAVYSFAFREGWNQGCIFVGADSYEEALAFATEALPRFPFEGDKSPIAGLWTEYRGVLEMAPLLAKWRAGL